MTLTSGLLVVLGALVGAPARYLTDRWLQSTHGTGVPWGTFAVNMAASLVLGVVMGAQSSAWVSALIGTGFCGTLSTWSTLGYETVRLGEERAWTTTVFNMIASVLAGLGAALLGLAIGASFGP